MKITLTPSQQKIYEEKRKLPDKELLRILHNETRYLSEVVMVVKYILTERGLYAAPEEEIRHDERNLKMNVDGPPYEKNFGVNSWIVIVLHLIVVLAGRWFLPVDPIWGPAIFILALVIVGAWSGILADKYCPVINRSKGLVGLAFFVPTAGMLVLRFLSPRIEDKTVSRIFSAAQKSFKEKSEEIRNSIGKNPDKLQEMLDGLKEKTNDELNTKIADYFLWLREDRQTPLKPSEINKKTHTILKEYGVNENKKPEKLNDDLFDSDKEPLPILDMTFEMNKPVSEENADKPTHCPACNHPLTGKDTTCPDCGINLE